MPDLRCHSSPVEVLWVGDDLLRAAEQVGAPPTGGVLPGTRLDVLLYWCTTRHARHSRHSRHARLGL